jgi:hypothetical protein
MSECHCPENHSFLSWYLVLGGVAVRFGFEPLPDLELSFAEILMFCRLAPVDAFADHSFLLPFRSSARGFSFLSDHLPVGSLSFQIICPWVLFPFRSSTRGFSFLSDHLPVGSLSFQIGNSNLRGSAWCKLMLIYCIAQEIIIEAH